MQRLKKVAISGSFDPLHTGHLEYIKEAKKYGDYLVVILKGNSRLERKKGNYLLGELERAAILKSIKEVDEVFIYDSDALHHSDISGALQKVQPDVYCAGADGNQNAVDACADLDIEVVLNVGGEKINSSSKILGTFIEKEKYKEIAQVMPIMCVDGIVIHNGKYLLVKRKNNPLKGIYWLPGGRVLKNETLENALHRKMSEELGIKVKIISMAGFYEDFYKENELGIDSVHTTAVVFLVSPIDLFITLDEQGEDYIWADELPTNLNLNVAKYL